ncbi:cell division protein FtsL [Paenibacillus thiaminolyticus]|uniref:Cell division protein FtsL n=1 Tax=Paenibacillus thiaminolyticus TaxID=49283 RepID=A0A3A3H7S4_PANTH|nr:cell division protein FtsL [Paenibacillus thiaminolyticus]RJG26086.1 cell division protein FtsL [Paenibacillus thiaminolyticus]
MAYTRGNLAVRPERQQQPRPKVHQTTKTVVRKNTLPTREKLLYLLTILLCTAVALVLIGRYAQIYDMNRQIQNLKRETVSLQDQTSVLRVEVEKLSDWKRVEEIARKNGLVFPETPLEIQVYKQAIGKD